MGGYPSVLVGSVSVCHFKINEQTYSRPRLRESTYHLGHHICQKYFTEEDVRVRDHCHITGKYRGAAYIKCNIIFRLTEKIPVIFHDLKGYDSHLIMQERGKFESNISVIRNNLEKYMAFFLVKNLKFIDSLQFMNDSLKKLAKNITISDMKYTSQKFQDVELMKRKDVYPYDYMDSFDKFNDKNLPSKEKFFCMLCFYGRGERLV